jgi:phosphoribosylglycinamide formyltransferase-1
LVKFTPKRVNILVLVSGGGTNLQALIDAERAGHLWNAKIAAVLSDKGQAYALKRAADAIIPTIVEPPDPSLPKPERRVDLSDRILKFCLALDIHLIVEAGFLSILAGEILTEYEGRIINLHPALLPKYGGIGMYGHHVHEAVIAAGEKESGCSVHLVTAGVDEGPVLLQRKVPVLPDDTPDTLAERIHVQEHIAIVDATRMMVERLAPIGYN